MQKDIYKDTNNLINRANPPKSLFTIEGKCAEYMIDDSYPYHYHDWYELYYLKHGNGFYRIGKREYKIQSGQWAFIPSGYLHKTVYNTSPHERFLIYFSKDYLSHRILAKMNVLIEHPIYAPEGDDVKKMLGLIDKIQEEFNNPDEFSPSIYKNALFEILLYFIRKPNVQKVRESDIYISHVIDYVNKNYSRELTLEILSDVVSISPSYLSRKFKEHMGLGLSSYIRLIRVRQAKRLLTETKMPISEISEKCGFSDSNYFSYVFNREENVSPVKYRKSTS